MIPAERLLKSMTDQKPKRMKPKSLIKVYQYGYMIAYYKCPYCGKVFDLEDAIADRKKCHRRYRNQKRRKGRKS